MIWTDEEIKKLSRHFAEETSNGDALDPHIDFATEYASEVIRWLHKNHCIVPKKKIAEWKGIVDDALKSDKVITERAFRFMWERLFEEEK